MISSNVCFLHRTTNFFRARSTPEVFTIRPLPEDSEPSLVEATRQEKRALHLFEKVEGLELLAYSQNSGLPQNSSLYGVFYCRWDLGVSCLWTRLKSKLQEGTTQLFCTLQWTIFSTVLGVQCVLLSNYFLSGKTYRWMTLAILKCQGFQRYFYIRSPNCP